MLRKINSKKGVSPIVATILLIIIAIVAIAIIFIWARSVIKEGVVKLGEPIENVCNDVSLDASLNVNNLDIVNTGGRVGLEGVALKDNSGDLHVCDINIPPGGSGSVDVTSCDPSVIGDEVKSIIPILRSDDGETYNCEKNEIKDF